MRIKELFLTGLAVTVLTSTAFTWATSLKTSVNGGNAAAAIPMRITVSGLGPGEVAVLRIGRETGALEIENALFEYPIQGTGNVITVTIAPVLEDGHYLLILGVPGRYFRDPKGYLFNVLDSVITNPTDKMINFNLGPLPSYPASEAVVDLSAPPKEPIQIEIPSPLGIPIGQKFPGPYFLAAFILISFLFVMLTVIFIWRRTLKKKE